MSKRQIEEGHKVEITTEDEHNGLAGIVRHVFRSRGEASVYSVAIEGLREPLSFIDGELVSLEPRRRAKP